MQSDLTDLSPRDLMILAKSVMAGVNSSIHRPPVPNGMVGGTPPKAMWHPGCAEVLHSRVCWMLSGEPDEYALRQELAEHLAEHHGWRHTAADLPQLRTLLRIHNHAQMDGD